MTTRPEPVAPTSAAPGAIRRHRYATTDLDQGAAFLRDTYVEDDLTLEGPTDAFGLDAEHLQVGTVFVTNVRTTVPVVERSAGGVPWPAIVSPSHHGVHVDTGSQAYRLPDAGAVLLARDHPFTLRWMSIEGVGLDWDLLTDLAGDRLEVGQQLVFDFGPPVSPTAGEHWVRTLSLVRQVGRANADRPHSDLLADELGRLLTSAALLCFRNPTLAGPGDVPSSAGPESLRRAVAFIDANVERPLTLGEISAAARVSSRALNETFRRHLGTTPVAYLRRARLTCAHDELRAARRGDGTTVTAVAARWGFHSLPRFGVLYRTTYGTTPSHTMRCS